MIKFPFELFEEVIEGSDLGGGADEPIVTETKTQEQAPEVEAASTEEVSEVAAETKPFYSDLPEDWRKQLASANGIEPDSEDYAKRLKQLERLTSMDMLAKNYFEAQEKIRSGQIKSGLPDDATEEQLNEWREANGVPATADAYALELSEGLVLGDGDERIMSRVYEAAHKHNLPASAVSELANSVLAGRQAEAEARSAQDGIDRQTSDRLLKETWGQDTRANINIVAGLVNQLPETVRDSFMQARMPDGKGVFNSPEVMIAFAEWARTINPSATVVPGSNNPMGDIAAEIKTLESKMGTDEWFSDSGAQKRYMELLDAQKSMG